MKTKNFIFIIDAAPPKAVLDRTQAWSQSQTSQTWDTEHTLSCEFEVFCRAIWVLMP